MIKLNNVEITPTIFPDKTSQVWKIKETHRKNSHYIEWIFESEAELFHLIQLVDLIEHLYPEIKIKDLHVPFLPYGRQDKAVSNTSTFALRSFLRTINMLNFRKKTTIDMHSNLATYFDWENIEPYKQIMEADRTIKPTLVCFPDSGAKDRYSSIPICENPKTSYCSFSKERDQQTGYIKRLYLNEVDVNIKGENILIIDDLCDGGMTFILTAKRLYELGAKEVNLYVSHGIFSKGLEPLREAGIKRFFTKDGEVTESKMTY